jgi:hypothetical protein
MLGKSFDERDFWAIWLPSIAFRALKTDVRYRYYIEKIKPRTAAEEEQIHESYIATRIFPAHRSREDFRARRLFSH